MFYWVLITLIIVILWMAYTDSCGSVRDGVNSFLNLFKSNSQAAPPAKEGFSAMGAVVAPETAHSVDVGDYAAAIQDMGLEKSIGESHSKFANELSKKTSTASKFTTRDDPNDIVPWVGIFRRPRYNVAKPLSDARVVSSESPEQMYVRDPVSMNWIV